MNYDKQKPISDEKLLQLKQNAVGYRIDYLPRYPKDNKHFEAITDVNTGFVIYYNADAYIIRYKNKESVLQKENMWVVFSSKDVSGLFKYNKEFEHVEDAVKYVYKIYEQELEREYTENKTRLEEIKKLRLNK